MQIDLFGEEKAGGTVHPWSQFCSISGNVDGPCFRPHWSAGCLWWLIGSATSFRPAVSRYSCSACLPVHCAGGLARIDCKFTRAMAGAYGWLESRRHHFDRQTGTGGTAGLAKSPPTLGIAFTASPAYQTPDRVSMSWRAGHKKTAVAASDVNGIFFKAFAQPDKKFNQ